VDIPGVDRLLLLVLVLVWDLVQSLKIEVEQLNESEMSASVSYRTTHMILFKVPIVFFDAL
jgi:hypothetical protein